MLWRRELIVSTHIVCRARHYSSVLFPSSGADESQSGAVSVTRDCRNEVQFKSDN